jgi:competence protein ComEA
MRTPRTGSLIVLGLAIVAVAVIVSIIAPWGKSTVVSSTATATASAGAPAAGAQVGGPSESSFDAGLSDDGTWVHVVGAVREPGLYLVTAGSRVVDAVMAAGGITDSADQCGINLARPLSDGEQLIVPTQPAGVSAGVCATSLSGNSSGGSSGPVSLSRADLATLDSLPGIGPTLAQRIIDWRTTHGGFTSVDQLAEVSGIGDKLFAELQPLVSP